ncbi:MAG: hypothetical protein K2L62_02775, partial [Muribaculaceae bacterium]|nr:hypothetical protein [Muribaculaceae bacterium]
MKKNQIAQRVALLLVAAISTVGIAAQGSRQQPGASASKRPQLVVGIMVDGLSMDYLELLRDNFSEGGFRRLMEQG